ncbi:MAG: HAD-IA family hydrolase [Pseudonocardiaceae bacterium]|nr:HAD-IA family hydrolase [Pseudonocardiaceae bacterium]
MAVAKELRTRLDGIDAPETNEPFELLNYVAQEGLSAASAVEAELAQLEIEAVSTATPTSGATEVLRYFADAGRRVVVVSNNSASAIDVYLRKHALGSYVAGVSARTKPDPGLLKPNPHLLHDAVALLRAEPSTCVMVGDSLTDIDAARAAGCPAIGYANKPGKRERFAVVEPTAIIDHMTDLLRQERTRQ